MCVRTCVRCKDGNRHAYWALPDQFFEGGAKMEPHDPPQFRTLGNVGLWEIGGCEQFIQIYHQTDKPLVYCDNMVCL